MGWVKDAKTDVIRDAATKAWESGRGAFTPKLNSPGSASGFSGEIVEWGMMIDAIESVGWAMTSWAVSTDAKGRPEAYPLFRRP